MAWTLVVIAGVLEVVWAFAMKQSQGFTRPLPTIEQISRRLLRRALPSHGS